MLMEFYKYEGAGNDFIIIDDRSHSFPQTDFQLVKQLIRIIFGLKLRINIFKVNNPILLYKLMEKKEA